MASDAKRIDYLEDDELEERTRGGPRGIAGWLWIPVITLLIVAFQASHAILDSELARASQEILAGNLVLAAASVALLALMFARHELVPMLMVVFYLVLLGVNTLEYLAIDRLMFGVTAEVASDSAQKVIHDLRQTMGLAIIWIPYFLVSRRVKNTFTR